MKAELFLLPLPFDTGRFWVQNQPIPITLMIKCNYHKPIANKMILNNPIKIFLQDFLPIFLVSFKCYSHGQQKAYKACRGAFLKGIDQGNTVEH